jgi:gluconolactonase
VNDLTVSKAGHAYVTSGGVLHMKPSGEVEAVGQGLNTNGIIMSPDEKILYVTNGAAIAAFDVAADGSLSNQREFGRLEGGGGGDGMAVDSEGRLYVTGGVGVHVLGKDGKYLGVIPTPRAPITLAFSGPDKKTLYVGTMGVTMGDGKEYLTTDGRRNTAMTVYKVAMQSQGFKGRAR